MFSSALDSVSLEAEPSVVVIGKWDIDIWCIVDTTNFTGIYVIQQKRSNKTVVEMSKNEGLWKEAALENKTEITVNVQLA